MKIRTLKLGHRNRVIYYLLYVAKKLIYFIFYLLSIKLFYKYIKNTKKLFIMNNRKIIFIYFMHKNYKNNIFIFYFYLSLCI